MRSVVDLTLCQAYAQCVFLAPQVFEYSSCTGAKALPYRADAPDEQFDRAPTTVRAD
ncbi:ferredoxin [Streptomyces scopuliridis]|uniref:ferredoxin n=1 Tax=Streptomyces scopuliridis TaxID=452529 RepID=UPI001FD03A51|nr:ferredoxin [Streptomyces scopuliridis]